MKAHILASAMVLISSSTYALDAGELLAHCEGDISRVGDYVSGFIDKHQDDTMVVGILERGADPKTFKAARDLMGHFCPPPEANLAAAMVTACDWIKANPEKHKVRASNALAQAYADKWPCK